MTYVNKEKEILWHLNWMPKTKLYNKNYDRKTLCNYSRKIAKKFLPEICSCGTKEKLWVHHKNRIWWDLRIKNLEWLCRKCHWKEHEVEQLPMLQSAFEGHRHSKESLIKISKHSIDWWKNSSSDIIAARNSKVSKSKIGCCAEKRERMKVLEEFNR